MLHFIDKDSIWKKKKIWDVDVLPKTNSEVFFFRGTEYKIRSVYAVGSHKVKEKSYLRNARLLIIIRIIVCYISFQNFNDIFDGSSEENKIKSSS